MNKLLKYTLPAVFVGLVIAGTAKAQVAPPNYWRANFASSTIYPTNASLTIPCSSISGGCSGGSATGTPATASYFNASGTLSSDMVYKCQASPGTNAMTQLVNCVASSSVAGAYLADATAINGGTIPASTTYTFSNANNMTLLLGVGTFAFSGSYSTAPITVNGAGGLNIIGRGGGGSSEVPVTGFDFSAISTSSTNTADVNITTNNDFLANFQVKGNYSNLIGGLKANNISIGAGVAAINNIHLQDVDNINAANNGVAFSGSAAGCTDCWVHGGYTHRVLKSGYEVSPALNFHIDGVKVLDTALSVALNLSGKGGFGIHSSVGAAGNPSDIWVTNNYVGTSATTNGTGGATDPCNASSTNGFSNGCNQGIELDGAFNCTITGNTVHNTQKEGIPFTCINANVTNNRIDGGAWQTGQSVGGIMIYGDNTLSLGSSTGAAQYFNVANNIISGTGAGADYCIDMNNGVNNNNFTNGAIHDNICTDIYGTMNSGIKLVNPSASAVSDTGVRIYNNDFTGASNKVTVSNTGGGSITASFNWFGNYASGTIFVPSASGVTFSSPNYIGQTFSGATSTILTLDASGTLQAYTTTSCSAGTAYTGFSASGTPTCTAFVSTSTGNWAGTWQGVNSSTFYLASNPSAFVTAASSVTWTANQTFNAGINIGSSTPSNLLAVDGSRNVTSTAVGSGLTLSAGTLSANVHSITVTTTSVDIVAHPVIDNTPTSTTNNSVLSTYFTTTLVGNTLKPGKSLHIQAYGNMLNASSSNSAYTFNLIYGGTTVCSGAGGATASSSATEYWSTDYWLTDVSSTNLQYCSLRAIANGTQAIAVATSTIDSTVNQTFTLQFRQTIASASNTLSYLGLTSDMPSSTVLTTNVTYN